MTRYTPDSKERVRDAVDMLALVSTRTELRRAGVNSYFGRCPFHDERTGSFHVRPEEKHYHCFGCQLSGDPFDFVMESEGLDFRGALESLADRFGDNLTIYGPTDVDVRGGAVSFLFDGIHAHDISQVLDEDAVCVRAGHHCAKPLMRVLGVPATTRASFYVYNDEADADALIDALDRAEKFFAF